MAAYSSEVVPRIRVFRSRYFLSNISADHSGVLEGEQLVKGSSGQSNLWYHEQPVVYHDSKSHSRLDHTCLRPIGTTSSPDPSSERKFQDWTVLSHPESHFITMQIYVSRICPESLGTLVCFNMSNSSDNTYDLLCRTYLHRQHPSDQDITHYTRL